jgi:hypothetical protein
MKRGSEEPLIRLLFLTHKDVEWEVESKFSQTAEFGLLYLCIKMIVDRIHDIISFLFIGG